MADRYVIVTDYSRGVAYGRLVEWDRVMRVAVLADARHIYYWAKHEDPSKGAMPAGLAAVGPADGSKVSAAAPRMEITNVAKVIDCTDVAVKRFGEARWS